MKKVRAVLFCGHQSPYGWAHLEPLLRSEIEIVKIILATNQRWNHFRNKLLGITTSKKSLGIQRWLSAAKSATPAKIVSALKNRFSKSVHVQSLLKGYRSRLICVDDVNTDAFIHGIKEIAPDLIICAAYPQIFKKQLFSTAREAALNMHPSLLPRYRGAHPHFWAIRRGEEESGLTAHMMTEKIDQGDIVAQIKYSIKGMDYESLYQKMIEETPRLIKKVEDYFVRDEGELQKQDDSQASYFKNDKEIDHKILWCEQSVQDIYNLVRTNVAFCQFRGERIILRKGLAQAGKQTANDLDAGSIVDLGGDPFVIAAKDGRLAVQEVIYKSRRLSSQAFVQKHHVKVGERFE